MMRSLLPAVVLLLAAHRAPAQEQLDVRGVDAETVARVAEIAATASSSGLPADPVFNEMKLGALYHVAGSRIVAAARSVAERLAVARAALQPEPTTDDIKAGAEALKYGISEAVLRDIRKARKGPVAVPIGVLIQLVSSPNNMKVERASAIVLDLVRRGADTRIFADLGNAVNADVAQGKTADQSLAWHLESLQPLLGPGAGSAGTTSDSFTTGATSPPPRKRP
jgi:hypothetical protein